MPDFFLAIATMAVMQLAQPVTPQLAALAENDGQLAPCSCRKPPHQAFWLLYYLLLDTSSCYRLLQIAHDFIYRAPEVFLVMATRAVMLLAQAVTPQRLVGNLLLAVPSNTCS